LNRSKSPRDLAIDPIPEITEPPLKNLPNGEEFALKEGKVFINIPAMSALFLFNGAKKVGRFS
jgi:hypothetical protein